MTARVVHVNDRVPGAVYVGRAMGALGMSGSPFGNPFRIGEHGGRAFVFEFYRGHLLASPDLLARLPELRDRPWACWCRRDGEPRAGRNACHADVLVGLLEAHSDGELRAMAAEAAIAKAEWGARR